MIALTRVSCISGKSNTMELPIEQSRIDELVKTPLKWKHPTKLIQDAFPELTADQREFILTGITPEEWKEMFGDDN